MTGLAWLAWLVPDTALAHGSTQGLGAFWNGVIHAWTEPSQLLALLALGLWLATLSLQRTDELRSLLAGAGCFGLAMLAALLSGQGLPIADSGLPERLLQGLGLLMALATVTDLATPRPATARLAPLACGLTLLGAALASPAGTLRGLDALGWTAGVALGVSLTITYTAIGARWVRQRLRIGPVVPRVLASWLAASLLLVMVLPWVSAPRPGAAIAKPVPASAPQR
ncbi:hypothetical protein [Aquabacterium sp. OR-4]|uniref:hypothetical protein n=1 Tax=Aquabacterium sp. OR-4 TaxID=2978127 RepID=UPI0021B3779F|nr:hypothetical protein [Aquabacterium sp. OR-4]MDT7835827.1 hypothetical protein [Aquabacterium sp. OR-4]